METDKTINEVIEDLMNTIKKLGVSSEKTTKNLDKFDAIRAKAFTELLVISSDLADFLIEYEPVLTTVEGGLLQLNLDNFNFCSSRWELHANTAYTDNKKSWE